jgi:hypothetical protein
MNIIIIIAVKKLLNINRKTTIKVSVDVIDDKKEDKDWCNQ